MPIVVATLLYIGAHFVMYIAVARNRITFRSEKAVFVYHALPFVMILATLTAMCVMLGFRMILPALVLSTSLLSIYSMSFLEIWSISQGSIYFGLLSQLADSGDKAVEASSITSLVTIGKSRSDLRRHGLEKLGLIDSHHAKLRLTGTGVCFYWILQLIGWTAVRD